MIQRNQRLFALVVIAIVALIGGTMLVTTWRQRAAPSLPSVDLAGGDPSVVAAIEHARAAVQLAPHSAADWGQLGMVLMVHEFNGPAVEAFAQAERLAPREPRWPWLAGLALLPTDPTVALALMKHGAALCVGDCLPQRLRLADALVEHGELDDAGKLFGDALAQDLGNARALLGLGRIALARGRVEEGLDYLNRSRSDPRTAQPSEVLLATVFRRLGDERAAEQSRRRAAELREPPAAWSDPFLDEAMQLRTGLQAWLESAAVLQRAGDVPQAVSVLERVVAQRPTSATAWRKLGAVRRAAHQSSAAETALRTALALDPTESDSEFQLGLVLLDQGRRAEAAAAFRRATELKPTFARAYYFLAGSLRPQGDCTAVMEALRAAIRYQPDMAEPYLALGIALAEEGRTEEAVAQLQRAVQLNPQDPRPAILLVRLRLARTGGD